MNEVEQVMARIKELASDAGVDEAGNITLSFEDVARMVQKLEEETEK